MEGEIRNGIVVWITVLASLCYCHTIAKFIPKGPLSSSNPPITLRHFILFACLPIKYKELIHPKVILVFYCLHVYLMLELLLVTAAALVPTVARLELELERPFNEPYLSTSLQNFWGRRWNLIVSDILRSIVYHPVRSICSPLIGKKWAVVPAVLATFFVSGIMHELIFYHAGRLKTHMGVEVARYGFGAGGNCIRGGYCLVALPSAGFTV
ncbi:MBOAT (membrane bound O-acyl transferase) family protein [Actinidia rufa]|uniref:MBOAT (Membrane bound O-acyl transferase) family protein n=1 Tax=Actinidia rufa TaxID=165716 RepID=A0A7J0EXI2_9ERIC|nr:MBOAT (membrane bound O-acyl transferase) family protein [Actinidia rufa]